MAILGVQGSQGLLEFIVLFCVHALLVRLSLIKVHKRPDFDGCFYWSGNRWYLPSLAIDYYTCTALKTYLLLTEGQLTSSLNTGTKTFIISKRFDYITVCSLILSYQEQQGCIQRTKGETDFHCVLFCLFSHFLFKNIGFVERQYYLQSALHFCLLLVCCFIFFSPFFFFYELTARGSWDWEINTWAAVTLEKSWWSLYPSVSCCCMHDKNYILWGRWVRRKCSKHCAWHREKEGNKAWKRQEHFLP